MRHRVSDVAVPASTELELIPATLNHKDLTGTFLFLRCINTLDLVDAK